MELVLRTPAKINPVLEVLSKRSDGFHELALLFQAVTLYDELGFSKQGKGIRLVVEESSIPLASDGSNLVVKAAELFREEILKGEGGVEILLKKRIPLAAGMGGGSSDAAATLRGLDWLFGTKAGDEKLYSLASRLGSDVAFFLAGGTALGLGRGEKITPLASGPSLDLVLVKPDQGLPTADVYRSGKATITSGEKALGFGKILLEGDRSKIAGGLLNGLESAAIHLMPEIGRIKRQLMEKGALGALVSGSGPTVFGIAESPAEAARIGAAMEEKGRSVFIAGTVSTGIERG